MLTLHPVGAVLGLTVLGGTIGWIARGEIERSRHFEKWLELTKIASQMRAQFARNIEQSHEDTDSGAGEPPRSQAAFNDQDQGAGL